MFAHHNPNHTPQRSEATHGLCFSMGVNCERTRILIIRHNSFVDRTPRINLYPNSESASTGRTNDDGGVCTESLRPQKFNNPKLHISFAGRIRIHAHTREALTHFYISKIILHVLSVSHSRRITHAHGLHHTIFLNALRLSICIRTPLIKSQHTHGAHSSRTPHFIRGTRARCMVLHCPCGVVTQNNASFTGCGA